MARVSRLVITPLMGVLTIGAMLFAPAGASEAATAEDVAGEAVSGIYVADGSEPVDTEQVVAAIEDATAAGLQLTVVVLADTPDAVAFAGAVNDLVGGTVLVFTPAEYGAASRELSQSEMDEILDQAGPGLGGDDVAAGVSAFVSAATPGRRIWPIVVVGFLLAAAAVVVVGRRYERNAVGERRRAALTRRWNGLRHRVEVLSDPILDMSTKVELDGRAELVGRYRNAASEYGELRDSLDKPPAAPAVEGLERRITELEGLLAEIDRELRANDAG